MITLKSMQNTAAKVIPIAIGIVGNQQNQLLISKRANHVHQAGLWEFPGGKINPGELSLLALARELKEEVGIVVKQAIPLIRISHAYAEFTVVLKVYRIIDYTGIVYAAEGQQLRWVKPQQFAQYRFPSANKTLIKALSLPAYYLITGDEPNPKQTNQFLSLLESHLQAGIKLVQLRAKSLSQQDYLLLAEQAFLLTQAYQAKLLLNASVEWLLSLPTLPADGLHLTSKQLLVLSARPLANDYLIAASCHNLSEIKQAESLGLDFVVLSPIAKTKQYQTKQLLGWYNFALLVQATQLPVFALGGMQKQHLTTAYYFGGQGIAAINGLWSN